MNTFFKENFALLIGFILVVLLVAIFLLKAPVAKTLVAPPQYDAVFAAYGFTTHKAYGAYYNDNYKVSVIDGNLVINTEKPANSKSLKTLNIIRFDHNKLQPQELNIDLMFPNVIDERLSDTALNKLNEYHISPRPISPDGYQFRSEKKWINALLYKIFGIGKMPRFHTVLYKNGHNITINEKHLFQAELIGWIIEDE